MTGLQESGHWYDLNGSPRYTVPYADPRKGERPTTLRDAKKHRLVPSVTTIEKIIAAPALENWKAKQVLLAAATHPTPREEYGSDDDWIKAIEAEARDQAKQAADRGSAIHGAIELALFDKPYPVEYRSHVTGALMALEALDCEMDQWYSEQSFAHPLGFGGKVDVSHPGIARGDRGIVADFKTKEFTKADVDAGKVKAWDNHARQLAAYREGLKMPRAQCYNIFISVTEPGLVHVHAWDDDEIAHAWEEFKAILAVWKLRKKYDPTIN